MTPFLSRTARLFLFCLFAFAWSASAQNNVPAPVDVFGFEPGDDYKLATYTQMVDYYRQLDAASDRVQMVEIGTSVLGRPLLLLFISSRDNLRRLDTWRTISEKMARARIDDAEAQQLAQEGKAIVWIDGGLHASELAHGQMTSLLAYRVATEETPEMQRIRDEVVLLLMPVMNPDGLDIMESWYRQNLGTPYETTSPPWLYHHYIGHDNNRDWFMNNMPESAAVTEVLYNQWYPQIVYNHHQTSPAWARIFIPPFADPVNPNIHPGVTTSVNLIGSAMANRFAIKDMPGVISNVVYSMWWNGGMRTVPYFHNMVGILTETAHATPTPRFYDPASLPETIANRRGIGIPTSGTDIFYPNPWKGGTSHFRDPVRYMLTASMAVLNIAADLRHQWLYNIYQMGRDAIAEGETSNPRTYIIPADQWDPGEAVNLVNILRVGGVEIYKTTQPFTLGDSSYAAGSFVIPAAQAFRPYVMDLLEKQTYPDRRSTPNGPPDPPYDIAGWTLPMQMGVRVDRLNEPVGVSMQVVTRALSPESGTVTGRAGYGYVLSHKQNAAFKAVNALLRSGERVYWMGAPYSVGDQTFETGSLIIADGDTGVHRRLEDMAQNLGLHFTALAREPDVPLHLLKQPRIGLYKSWQANMDEGWTRWLLESYAFPVDTLHDTDIQAGNLSRYDAIVLPHQSKDGLLNGHAPGTRPDAYTGGLGAEGTLALKQYVGQGGTLITLDAASDFAIDQFGLPVRNVVAGRASNEFYIPGSLIRLDVETDNPLAYGMQPAAAAVFVRSRAFEAVQLDREGEGGSEDIAQAPAPEVDIVARYARNDLLMSGWALGEDEAIGGKAALMRVPLGAGNVVLFGFRPQFRGQPRGTYKLFFNALHAATFDIWPGQSLASD